MRDHSHHEVRLGDIRTAFRVLSAYGRIDPATAGAVAKAMCRAVARNTCGLRLVPCRIYGRRGLPAPEDLPSEIAEWQHRAVEAGFFYRFDQRDLRMVRDWVLSTRERDPRLYGKIPRMDWPAIRAHAERRHARIAKAAARTIGRAATPGHVILRLDGGWTWHLLDTPELLDAEGASMAHCVGGGNYDRDCLIFSLRDPAGVSHATVEFVVGGGRISLANEAGPRNARLGDEHNAAILRLIRQIGAYEPGRSIP
ncbi:hypothetical protein [Aureimonas sp. AU40]|uniref:hypothetical protein n=1 Tax=Aureimonas sp. AU40 TaxID=1637747 RepID=UPI0007864533|nr:hypothetical protein [Aureimonas sp. AU40]